MIIDNKNPYLSPFTRKLVRMQPGVITLYVLECGGKALTQRSGEAVTNFTDIGVTNYTDGKEIIRTYHLQVE